MVALVKDNQEMRYMRTECKEEQDIIADILFRLAIGVQENYLFFEDPSKLVHFQSFDVSPCEGIHFEECKRETKEVRKDEPHCRGIRENIWVRYFNTNCENGEQIESQYKICILAPYMTQEFRIMAEGKLWLHFPCLLGFFYEYGVTIIREEDQKIVYQKIETPEVDDGNIIELLQWMEFNYPDYYPQGMLAYADTEVLKVSSYEELEDYSLTYDFSRYKPVNKTFYHVIE